MEVGEKIGGIGSEGGREDLKQTPCRVQSQDPKMNILS